MPARKIKLDTIGGRMWAAREAKSLSRAEIADLIGVTRVVLHKWETDEIQNMGVGPLIEFTKITEVSLDWLLDRRGPDPDLED